MEVPRRALISHGSLIFYEIALVPLSFLAVFFALLLSGGLLAGAGLVGGGFGASEAVVSGFSVLVTVALIAGLSALGGWLVRGYQRYFDQSFSTLDPRVICSVPLVAFVGSIVVAVGRFDLLSPPWWLTLIGVVSAHALAFRAIAVYSMLDHGRRTGVRVGAIAALPAVLALVTLVTGEILDAGLNETGRLVVSTLSTVGIPQEPILLAPSPVVVGLAYALSLRDGGFDVDTRRFSLPVDVDRSLLDLSRVSGERDRSVASRSSGRNGPATAPPPSSPHRGEGDRATGRADRSVRSAFRGSGSSDADSSSDRSRESSVSGDGPSNATNGRPAGESDSSTGTSEAQADDSAATPDDTESTDGPGSTGSETRIFTGDFDEYTTERRNPNGSEPPASCPDCGTDVPRDGAYCPRCGTQL